MKDLGTRRTLAPGIAVITLGAMLFVAGCDTDPARISDEASEAREAVEAPSSNMLSQQTLDLYQNMASNDEVVQDYLLKSAMVGGAISRQLLKPSGVPESERRTLMQELSKKDPSKITGDDLEKFSASTGVDLKEVAEVMREAAAPLTQRYPTVEQLSTGERRALIEALYRSYDIQVETGETLSGESQDSENEAWKGDAPGTVNLGTILPDLRNPCNPAMRVECVGAAEETLNNSLAIIAAAYGVCIGACAFTTLGWPACAAACFAAMTGPTAEAYNTYQSAIQTCYRNHGRPGCENVSDGGCGGGGSGGGGDDGDGFPVAVNPEDAEMKCGGGGGGSSGGDGSGSGGSGGSGGASSGCAQVRSGGRVVGECCGSTFQEFISCVAEFL